RSSARRPARARRTGPGPGSRLGCVSWRTSLDALEYSRPRPDATTERLTSSRANFQPGWAGHHLADGGALDPPAPELVEQGRRAVAGDGDQEAAGGLGVEDDGLGAGGD